MQDALLQHRKLAALDRPGHLVQVCAGTEICARVADHHGPEGLRLLDLFRRREHQARRRDRIGVGLGAQAEQRDAVAHVRQGRVAVLEDDFVAEGLKRQVLRCGL